jgi:hypothetical protein
MMAIYYGFVEIVMKLLEKGVDRSVVDTIVNTSTHANTLSNAVLCVYHYYTCRDGTLCVMQIRILRSKHAPTSLVFSVTRHLELYHLR